MFPELWSRLEAAARRRNLDREVDAEMRFHLEMEIEERVQSGMPEDEARRAALVAFGGTTQTAEACREARLTWADPLWQDLRYAARGLRRRPGLSVAAVGLLGVAIGITTAMFTILDALVLRPAPFRDPGRLAHVWMRDEHGGPQAVPREVFHAWRRAPAFAGVESAVSGIALLGRDPDVVARAVATVTPGVFDLLGGVRPVLGRLFGASDGRPGSDDRVLVSEDVWRGLYHADPSLVGRRIVIDGRNMEVVGILPSDFRFPSWNTVLWKPASFDSPEIAEGDWPVAYVRFAATLPRGDALRVATRTATEAHASVAGRWAQAEPLGGRDWGYDHRRALPLLAGGAFLLFVVLCANVSGLLLGRLAARAHELRTHTAIGAPRSRLVRQAFLESAGLGLAGLALGLAIGWVLVSVAREVVPASFQMRSLHPLRMDVRALVVTSIAGLLATLGGGLLPAVVGTGSAGSGPLHPGDRVAAESVRARRTARALLAGQIALSCTLLLAATLLVRSFVNLVTKDRGLDATNVMVATVEMPRVSRAAPSTPAARAAVVRTLDEQVRSLPGVSQVVWSDGLPPDYTDVSYGDWIADTPTARRLYLAVDRLTVRAEFFAFYGITVLGGRTFDATDPPGSVLVGERFARALWPGRDPVGGTFSFQQEQFRVVGLVEDIRYPSLDARLDRPQFYERLEAAPLYPMLSLRCGSAASAHVRGRTPRSRGCPDAALLRQRLTAAYPGVSVVKAADLEDSYERELAGPRATAMLALAFSSAALLAAAAGLFSVLSHSVARQRRELGIRAALGASPADTRRRILREGMAVAVPGLVTGTAAGLLLSRVLTSFRYEMTMTDPVSCGVVVVVLAITIAAGSWHPIRDAGRADPAALLRED